MLKTQHIEYLNEQLTQSLKKTTCIKGCFPIAGGSINQTYGLQTENGLFFIKSNSATKFPQMFEAEIKGLKLLASNPSIEVPKVIFTCSTEDQAYLVLEFIKEGPVTNNFWESFGRGLAAMHQITESQFGLNHHNYIGALAQQNHYHETWLEFYINERINPLLKIATNQGLLNKQDLQRFKQLFAIWEQGFFPDEAPALLHGDLWSGNFMVNSKNQATIFDPAVYFGHREMDLAMTYLFSGFAAPFYSSYQEAFPLHQGFSKRLPSLQLYPLLVHLILFGRSYYQSINKTLDDFKI